MGDDVTGRRKMAVESSMRHDARSVVWRVMTFGDRQHHTWLDIALED